MKPRTLARYALDWIESGDFIFDSEDRKQEAIRQLRRITVGKANESNNPEDPIIEIHIGIYVPNFDYPIVPIDTWGNPFVWQEDNKYLIPGNGTHVVKGVGVSGTEYYLGFLNSLAPYRNSIIKVDKYTDFKRAAYALTCCVSQILNKKLLANTDKPLKLSWELFTDEYKKHDDVKAFEKQQKALYIKWLSKWISLHHKNPDTHLKILKIYKNITV